MKKIIIIILLILIIITTILIYYLENKSNKENYLWGNTISKYITGDLWDDINSYDAGHSLLVPMFYAFMEEDEEKIE